MLALHTLESSQQPDPNYLFYYYPQCHMTKTTNAARFYESVCADGYVKYETQSCQIMNRKFNINYVVFFVLEMSCPKSTLRVSEL